MMLLTSSFLIWKRCSLVCQVVIQVLRLTESVGSADIDSLVAARLEARKRKDFTESDRIRDELAKMGVVLKDSKDGTTWELAR